MTDIVNTEQLLCIIQSMPSKKAQSFKLWLAEATTTELTKTQNLQDLEENRIVTKIGGKIAGEVKERIGRETGNPVITSQSTNSLNAVVTRMIEGVTEAEEDNKK